MTGDESQQACAVGRPIGAAPGHVLAGPDQRERCGVVRQHARLARLHELQRHTQGCCFTRRARQRLGGRAGRGQQREAGAEVVVRSYSELPS